MANEQTIQQELTTRFGFLNEKIRVQRERRMYVDVPAEHFDEVFAYLAKNTKFQFLSTITGFDEGESLAFMYHLTRFDGVVLNIKTAVPKNNPIINTVTGHFPCALLYERELVDMFGAKVQGLPPGSRYPLPDSFPTDQYPLRKDWKPEMLEQGSASK